MRAFLLKLMSILLISAFLISCANNSKNDANDEEVITVYENVSDFAQSLLECNEEDSVLGEDSAISEKDIVEAIENFDEETSGDMTRSGRLNYMTS